MLSVSVSVIGLISKDWQGSSQLVLVLVESCFESASTDLFPSGCLTLWYVFRVELRPPLESAVSHLRHLIGQSKLESPYSLNPHFTSFVIIKDKKKIMEML